MNCNTFTSHQYSKNHFEKNMFQKACWGAHNTHGSTPICAKPLHDQDWQGIATDQFQSNGLATLQDALQNKVQRGLACVLGCWERSSQSLIPYLISMSLSMSISGLYHISYIKSYLSQICLIYLVRQKLVKMEWTVDNQLFDIFYSTILYDIKLFYIIL